MHLQPFSSPPSTSSFDRHAHSSLDDSASYDLPAIFGCCGGHALLKVMMDDNRVRSALISAPSSRQRGYESPRYHHHGFDYDPLAIKRNSPCQMALTVKQLNSNISFLLNFEPLGGTICKPFRILLNPVLPRRHSGPSTPYLSQSCLDLLEPDLVILTHGGKEGGQDCHVDEATLRQLPPGGTKTLILAEPSAAKTVEGWGYFDHDAVKTLCPWEGMGRSPQKRDMVVRVPVPPCYPGGNKGEVTVCLIPQQERDAWGIHSAIGITYRPPPSHTTAFLRRQSQTPPTSPNSSLVSSGMEMKDAPYLTARLVPPTPPDSPSRLHTIRQKPKLPKHIVDRTLSVIYSPHGTLYNSMEPYVTSHLIAEAALPLTALLHSFGTEAINPWWHLGNLGGIPPPVGQQAALALGSRAWINTRGEEIMSSSKYFPARRPNTYTPDELRDFLFRAEAKGIRRTPTMRDKMGASCVGTPKKKKKQKKQTEERRKSGPRLVEILELQKGKEVVLTCEGVWEPELEVPWQNGPDALGVFNNNSSRSSRSMTDRSSSSKSSKRSTHTEAEVANKNDSLIKIA